MSGVGFKTKSAQAALVEARTLRLVLTTHPDISRTEPTILTRHWRVPCELNPGDGTAVHLVRPIGDSQGALAGPSLREAEVL